MNYSSRGLALCASYRFLVRKVVYLHQLTFLYTEGLKFREEIFHSECFKCRSCSIPLLDRKGEFLLTEEGLQCKTCVKITM